MQKVNTKLPAFVRQEGGSMEQKNLDQIIRETVARYMNRSLIVAGNWKMNMTVREGMEFLEKLGPVDATTTKRMKRFRRKYRRHSKRDFP